MRRHVSPAQAAGASNGVVALNRWNVAASVQFLSPGAVPRPKVDETLINFDPRELYHRNQHISPKSGRCPPRPDLLPRSALTRACGGRRSASPPVTTGAPPGLRDLHTHRSATTVPTSSRSEGVGKEVVASGGQALQPPAPLLPQERKRGLSLALNEEIAEDFIAIRGTRPPRRPKKRPRTVQRQLDVSIGASATEIPSAGGSFSCLHVELDDMAAFLATGNILLEAVVGAAGLGWSWTSYLATLLGRHSDALRIHVLALAQGFNLLDPIAVIVLITTSVLAMSGARLTSTINSLASVVGIIIIAFVMGMLYPGLSLADVNLDSYKIIER